MNTQTRNLKKFTRNGLSKKASNKTTFLSLTGIAFGIFVLYGRYFKQVNTEMVLGMFLLITISIIITSIFVLSFSGIKKLTTNQIKINSKFISLKKITQGKLIVTLFLSLILGYVIFVHFFANLVEVY